MLRFVTFLLLTTSASAQKPAPTLPVTPAHILWDDPATRQSASRVFAENFARRPVAGTYLLLDTTGRVATLTLTRVQDHKGKCPYGAELAIDGALAHVPGDLDHLVVVGPIDDYPEMPAARLQFNGLAVAGSASDAPEDPLGAPKPAGKVPTFAVDLDGDGTADLGMRLTDKATNWTRTTFDHKRSVESWKRSGKKWKSQGRCRWTTHDLIGE